MNLKHHDILIPDDNPFINCQLNRKKYAEILTSIVENYADGFVLAINNEWGTGKTTFVKMWQQHLKNKEFQTLYFNAWENDFESNPLIAILSELKTLTGDVDKSVFKTLLSKGVKVSKSILPTLIKAIADKYIETKIITDAIEKISESATDLFEEEVNEYASKKLGLIEFKNELEKYIKKADNSKPIVFIIDELDRCRPDYAVQVLEKTKHFFNVPGIVFILSIDKEQLSNSIKGFYGSESINAAAYLRRFIDIEYNIPEPAPNEICNYLYNYFEFQEFFYSQQRIQHSFIQNDGSDFLAFASSIFENNRLTIRQQEKLFAHSRLVLKQFSKTGYVFPQLFFFLIYLRDSDSILYQKISGREFSLQELIDEIAKKIPQKIKPSDRRMFTKLETILLLLYCNYYREKFDYKISLTVVKDGKESLLINSSIDNDEFLLYIQSYRKENFEGLALNFILSKINLMENIIF